MALPCGAGEIVFAVSTGSAMPMTEFRHGVLTGGLLKEFGDALARELNATPRYLSYPRKRVEAALIGGQADLVCDLRPEWLDRKDWHWSASIFTNNMIIASRSDTSPLPQLAALAGQRVGTILGYRYREVEAALGTQFLRDEALTDEINLNKLLTQRFEYLLTNSLYFEYQRKVHPAGRQLNPSAYKVMSFDTYCALPPKGKLQLAKVNHAIQAMKSHGEIQAMLSRFRPAGN